MGEVQAAECRGRRVPGKLKKNNFPVTVKIRTSGYRTLEFLLQHSKLVHVGETCYNLQTLGCELHKNAFGGRALPGPTGEL